MSAPQPSPGVRLAVLLIDDEVQLLDSMRQGLEHEFDVETASSAEEGTLLAATRKYDVIVCDQLMPGEPGLEFLMRMASLHPKARRIMLTGYINPDLISRSIASAQLSACLLKPISIAELAKAIRKASAA